MRLIIGILGFIVGSIAYVNLVVLTWEYKCFTKDKINVMDKVNGWFTNYPEMAYEQFYEYISRKENKENE